MKPVRDTTFEFGYLASQVQPPAWSLTVVVKATFALVREGVCTIADEQLPIGGDVYYDDDVANSLQYDTDLAVYKPNGEFYVAGNCYAPGGRPVATTIVSAQVGRVQKQLAVFGDRFWRNALPSEPERFTTMPLRYERCFGGPGFASNPVGTGIADVKVGGALRRPLPNIENPRALIAEPTQRPEPHGLFPYPPTWRQRASRAGSYDETWQKTRWPALPADFDYGYYSAAPLDQQVQGFWRGDEAIVLQNLHPRFPTYETRLPGLVARVFLSIRGESYDEFREVAMQLDTVVIDADAERVVCLWRGVTAVQTEGLDEVLHAFITHETLTARRTPDQCEALFVAKRVGDDALVDGFSEEEIPTFNDAALSGLPTREEQEAQAELAAMEAKLAGVGPPPGASAPDPPAPTPTEALARLAAAGLPVPETVAALAALDAEAPAIEPSESIEQRLWRLRNEVLTAYAAGTPMPGEDLSEVDLSGTALPGVDFSGAVLTGARFVGANLNAAKFDGAQLARADFSGAYLGGASLAGADLEGAAAVQANLSGAVFTTALLGHARLAGSLATRADFSKADMVGVDLTGASLEEAKFDGANLGDVRMEQCTLARATFVGASLERVRAAQSVFDDADLTKVNASEGSDFTGASMLRVRAAGGNFAAARMNKADLSLSDFTKANFTGAGLVQARLNGCEFKSAVFRAALLVGAEMLKSNALDAVFEAADLSHADLRGSNLFGAEFVHANTTYARLELANVKRTILA